MKASTEGSQRRIQNPVKHLRWSVCENRVLNTPMGISAINNGCTDNSVQEHKLVHCFFFITDYHE